jgi:plasmid stabilization system protein ParE
MRARRLVMSQRALNDLLDIYDYIAQFNPVAARRLLDDINAKIEWMATLGITGVPRDFIPGLRALPYQKRCIYFLVEERKLIVLRVLHGRQKVSPDDFQNIED